MQEHSEHSRLPLVSVIIPVYNGEKYIETTIRSVISQSYSAWELIIINDGSKDNTEKIIIAAQHPQIRYISKPNSGVSDTRNMGIIQAKGDYIAFLDADDFWHPDNLEKKIGLLEKDKSISYVFSDMNNADENLKITDPAPVGKDENILEDLLLWNGEVIPGPGSNIVARKECFDSGIRFDPRLTTIADQHFTVQLAYQYRGKRIPEILWDYRILPGSMSKSLDVLEKDALQVYSIYAENNYFSSSVFRRKCFANMSLILAGSFWKDGKNKKKGFKYIFKALAIAPFHTLKKLLRKIF